MEGDTSLSLTTYWKRFEVKLMQMETVLFRFERLTTTPTEMLRKKQKEGSILS